MRKSLYYIKLCFFCFRFNKKALNTVLFSFELRLVQDFSFPFCLLFAVRGRLYVTDRV
ncbi:hypothetical protein BACEGG_03107 [Bacteroides eggerthii DSM 20697]|nr:hypothetical protein BACEGG_03107 [Bacteroides eggerthii DSM 20697]